MNEQSHKTGTSKISVKAVGNLHSNELIYMRKKCNAITSKKKKCILFTEIDGENPFSQWYVRKRIVEAEIAIPDHTPLPSFITFRSPFEYVAESPPYLVFSISSKEDSTILG